MKFLDIYNYLSAGTSLKHFYQSYHVSTPKGVLSLRMVCFIRKASSLPDDIEVFRSILAKETITPDQFQTCRDMWTRERMTAFANYICYYNNVDGMAFVEAVDKMVANERDNNNLDMFKDSISLSGLFRNIFLLVTILSISAERVPPSSYIGIRRKTSPRSKVNSYAIGCGSNSLYLYFLGQQMPTGYYTLQEEQNNYKQETRYSQEAIQWLEHVMRTDRVNIWHAENGGEELIENFPVNSYDESTRTVYEYHGCFWHKHFCQTNYDADVWNKRLECENSATTSSRSLAAKG